MKTLIYIILFTASFQAFSQSKPQYSYDKAGNRVLRKVPTNTAISTVKSLHSEKTGVGQQVTDSTGNVTLKLYPNPTNGEVTLLADSSFIATEPKTISLYDMNGKLLLQQAFTKKEEKVDLSTQQKGTYFIKIVDAKGYYSEFKVVKID